MFTNTNKKQKVHKKYMYITKGPVFYATDWTFNTTEYPLLSMQLISGSLVYTPVPSLIWKNFQKS